VRRKTFFDLIQKTGAKKIKAAQAELKKTIRVALLLNFALNGAFVLLL